GPAGPRGEDGPRLRRVRRPRDVLHRAGRADRRETDGGVELCPAGVEDPVAAAGREGCLMEGAVGARSRRLAPAVTVAAAVVLAAVALAVGLARGASPPPTLQERVQAVAAELR